ncbi:hypothetical protein GIJ48_08895 [Escherichia coli]|nr:hypothetical protein [Escherichia coli]
MELNTTPSPWKARDGFIYGADGDIVAEGYGYVADDNLIAAAPELLESLRELVSAMERYEIDVGESAPIKHKKMMKKAKAAIAKALCQQ